MSDTKIPAATLDQAAVDALRGERLSWRHKGMPSPAFGRTIVDFLSSQPTLSGSGFVGPLLTLDRAALDHNLATMARWCARHGIALAPHGKTTMAPQLFAEQLEHGAWGITAANLSQLRVYRAFGVSRVMLANQLLDPAGLRWLAAELDSDPGFSVTCWVDSVRGVELMTRALADDLPNRPVDVLVELGGEHGRTGARDIATAVDVAAAADASPVLRVAGVGGYEGAVAHDLSEHDVSTVDSYMARLRELVAAIHESGHLVGLDEVIVTAGGSAYFDQVAEALTKPWPADVPVLPVLRSGAYLTHDDGLYRRMSPFGRAHRLDDPDGTFRPAMRVWAQVTSRPEPNPALLTMGRRDVSFDQDLPEPQRICFGDGSTRQLAGCRVTELADQHAFLEVDAGADVEIGDWVGFGLSHPCTVFDKWSLIPVVDGDRVVDLVHTFF